MRRKAFYLLLLCLICGYSSLALGADQGPINGGETRSSTIGPPSFMDTWTFDGQAGERVLINAVTTSRTLDTSISLYPPGGGAREAYSSFSDQLDHQLQQTGMYTIVIEDWSLSKIGNYNITFLKMPGTVSSAADPDGGPIASGQTLSANINAASDLDAFQFYGQSGERVIINAVTTSGTLDTSISLYPPGGGAREAYSSFSDQLDHQLQQTGMYTIVIEDWSLSQIGNYNLTFLKIPGTVSSAADPDGGPIASGQTLSANINAASDLDAFQFYGQTGERAIINAVTTSGALDTSIGLYPPGGGAREAYSSFSDQLDHQLQQTGMYTIVIEDWSLSKIGNYNISLSKIPASPPPGIYNLSPANGATIHSLNGTFAWSAVTGATGYDLYFGSDPTQAPQKIGDNMAPPSMAFPALIRGKTYFWQVVAHTAQGDIQGPYCWFLVSMNPPGMSWLLLLLLQ